MCIAEVESNEQVRKIYLDSTLVLSESLVSQQEKGSWLLIATRSP